MTPALKRLFDDTRIRRVDRSYWKLQALFERHGEALIETLEQAASAPGQDWLYWQLEFAKLLAQLESEAQP